MKPRSIFITLVLTAILSPQILWSQSEHKTPFFYSVDYRTGFNKPKRSTLKDLASSYQGIDLKLGWQTIGKKDWQVAYRYPMLGVGLNYSKFDNPIIGAPLGAYFFTNFPQITTKWFRLDFEVNFGVCAGMLPFDSIANPKNIAISSSLNFQSGFYLEQSVNIGKNVDLFAAEGLTHISNGALGFPNMGINVRTLKLGIRYQPQFQAVQNKGKKLQFDRKWQLNTYLGSGLKTYNQPNPIYCEVLISPSIYYQPGYKRRIGLGFEVAYNEAVRGYYAYRPDRTYNKSKQFTLASHISHEFIIDKFTVLTQLGVYLKNQPFQWYYFDNIGFGFYERIGFGYYLTNHIRLVANLKAHYYIAEYIETGFIFDLNLN